MLKPVRRARQHRPAFVPNDLLAMDEANAQNISPG
jgi:hypothetical protein